MIGLATRGLFGLIKTNIISLATAGKFNTTEVVCPVCPDAGEVTYTTINKPTIDKIIYRDREKPTPRITVTHRKKKDEEISIGVKLL